MPQYQFGVPSRFNPEALALEGIRGQRNPAPLLLPVVAPPVDFRSRQPQLPQRPQQHFLIFLLRVHRLHRVPPTLLSPPTPTPPPPPPPQHLLPPLQQLPHPVPKAHRPAHVLGPVLHIPRFFLLDPCPRHIRDVGDLRRLQLHSPHQFHHLLIPRLHHPRRERMPRRQPPIHHPLLRQPPFQFPNRILRPRHHRLPRSIADRDRQLLSQQPLHFPFAPRHRQHRSLRQLLYQLGPLRHQPQPIPQAKHSCDR